MESRLASKRVRGWVNETSVGLYVASSSALGGDESFAVTFIYVRREASDKHLPGVALHPLSVLTAGRRVQARSQRRVNVAVVEETVLEGKKTGAT